MGYRYELQNDVLHRVIPPADSLVATIVAQGPVVSKRSQVYRALGRMLHRPPSRTLLGPVDLERLLRTVIQFLLHPTPLPNGVQPL